MHNNDHTFDGNGRDSSALRDGYCGRPQPLSLEENIRQSLVLLLTTAPGQRANKPDYGCRIRQYISDINDIAVQAQLRGHIEQAIEMFEPRVVPDNICFEEEEKEFIVRIRIDYTIRQTDSRASITCPFYMEKEPITVRINDTDTDNVVLDANDDALSNNIEIPNAGLCLLAPYIPQLFAMLDLLAENKQDFQDDQARIKALCLLQRIAMDNKRSTFIRILTSCPPDMPLPASYRITQHESDTIESMISAIKASWHHIRNTSNEGVLQSFIRRPGRLEQQDDRWVLHVEEKPHDILLASIPWSYRRIQFPWMKKHVEVKWRDKASF